MEIFESLVGQFLTCDNKVFIAPQYDLDWDAATKAGGDCPDFVVIDENRSPREVIVVEVTTRSSLTDLKNKILERQSRWFAPLRARFDTDVRMIAFIRQELVDKATTWADEQNIPRTEVCFFPLEKATFSWEYWTTRRQNGLPR